MLPRDLRRKLGRVARGETVESGAAPSSAIPRAVLRTDSAEAPQPTDAGARILCHAAPPLGYDPRAFGRPVVAGGGEFLLIEHPASLLVPGTESIPDSLARAAVRAGIRPEEYLFLDIETTSLTSAQPLFLIGLLVLRESELTVVQLFARDYTEEPAALAYLAELSPAYKLLVTFNGRTFDVPYLRDRAAFHRQPFNLRQEHLDLLQHARSTWKGRYPDLRLQTLEAHLCGRRRLEDTPGHLIPELYHEFVRTPNWPPLQGVFYHNALDLLTMAELVGVLGIQHGGTEGKVG